jgi:cell division protein FtsZ
MSLNIAMVKDSVHQPRIMVVGVGGGGGNAVDNMIKANLDGATFAVANTDLQALERHPAEVKLQLGKGLTEGLGAGANPEVGEAAAEESYSEICEALRGSHMVFVTAGMGGGTGTGAAPVVARAAREMGILTVAVVTKPFGFEGTRRMKQAEAGILELQNVADTVIVIPNQNLFRIATERTTLQDAFKLADDVLYKGVRGVTDLMLVPGIINLDFNDVKTVMSEMGQAMMGTGEAEGERRAILAAEMAISSPLLDGISMQGAKGVLINITGGDDLTLYEVDEAANRIREEVDPDANIIFGTAYDAAVTGKIRVSVVATGLGETAKRKTTNMVDLSVLKKPETAAHVEAPKADVKDFGQALAAKQRERDEEADEYANLEIPAFLRRQAN